MNQQLGFRVPSQRESARELEHEVKESVLRISGVPTDAIQRLGENPTPRRRCARCARVSISKRISPRSLHRSSPDSSTTAPNAYERGGRAARTVQACGLQVVRRKPRAFAATSWNRSPHLSGHRFGYSAVFLDG